MPTEDSKDALLARLGRTEDWSVAGRDFREIFSEFYPLVLQYFARQGFGEEDSRDLAQETMLRVYRSLPAFSGDAQLGTWVFQVTANVCRNAVRTRTAHKRSTEALLDEWTDRGPDPVDESEGPLRPNRRALEAMDGFDTLSLQCLTLWANLEVSEADVALRLQVPEEEVRRRLDRAAAKLDRTRQEIRGPVWRRGFAVTLRRHAEMEI